jgi:hypothetical protein
MNSLASLPVQETDFAHDACGARWRPKKRLRQPTDFIVVGPAGVILHNKVK